MVQANEFRIGNLVFDKNGSVSQVNTIGFGSVRLSTNDYKCESMRLEEINPIPLTEEWLKKLGFEETYNSRFRLKFDHPLNYIGFDFSKNEDKSMEGFRCYGHYIKIKYVHELQNLFFALTGDELTIKE